MSDTVAVALIAVSGTLGSGYLSYLASRRNTEVQLTGVKAEIQRLRESHAEEHRRERQEAYYEFISVLQRTRQLCYGISGPVTEEAYLEIISQFGTAHTNVSFLGESNVFPALDQMLEIFQEFTSLVAEADDSSPFKDQLGDPFEEIVERWNESEGALIEAMKDDIASARRAEENIL